MSKGYTTRQAIENYMLITIDPSFYAQVDDWISDAEDIIDGETERNFAADASASGRLYDGDGSNELIIDDCIAVTEITIDGGTPLALTTDYLLYPANKLPKTRIKLLTTKFHRGHQNVSVKAKWGYSTVAPRDIRFAATVIVSGIIGYAWKEGEVQSETIGRYQVTYKTGAGDDSFADYEKAKDIIASYEKQTL